MERLNIQIINPKAKMLLLDLEEMDLIKIDANSMNTDAVELWEDLKNAAQEVRSHKEGKLNLKTAKMLLNEPDMIFEPDEDFYKSITMEDVRERLHNVVNKLYENK